MTEKLLFQGDVLELFKSDYYYDRIHSKQWYKSLGLYLVIDVSGFTRVPEGSNISVAGDIVVKPLLLRMGSTSPERISMR